MAANPYAGSVNWSCTMEAALRILSWTWFFRVFHASRSWADAGFRERFLCALYLHGDFTERHLEISDVNGNHCTADAAGLVFAGLFFGQGADAGRWLTRGWSLLCEELPRQVYPDGVDFEASVAYHRLVAELFLLPALYRRACALDVPDRYRERLIAMARFSAAYSRPDGTSAALGRRGRRARPAARRPGAHRPPLPRRPRGRGVRGSGARERFGRPARRGVLAARAGRGRLAARVRDAAAAAGLHGLSGRRLLRDAQRGRPRLHRLRARRPRGPRRARPQRLPGLRGRARRRPARAATAARSSTPARSPSATASARRRITTRLASTAQEINRIDPERLWTFENDARPRAASRSRQVPSATASGARTRATRGLSPPVTPVRTIELDHRAHALVVHDSFEGTGRSPPRGAAAPRPGVEASAALARPRSSCARRGRRFVLDVGSARGLGARDRGRPGLAELRRGPADRPAALHARGTARAGPRRAHRAPGRAVTAAQRAGWAALVVASVGSAAVALAGLAAALRLHAAPESGTLVSARCEGAAGTACAVEVARDQPRSLLARGERAGGGSPQPRVRASGHARGRRGALLLGAGASRLAAAVEHAAAGSSWLPVDDARSGRRSAPARAPALGHRGRRPGARDARAPGRLRRARRSGCASRRSGSSPRTTPSSPTPAGSCGTSRIASSTTACSARACLWLAGLGTLARLLRALRPRRVVGRGALRPVPHARGDERRSCGSSTTPTGTALATCA